ncbi:MAG: hypothetical protein U0638_09465 [Phycisphaerales bacterium]
MKKLNRRLVALLAAAAAGTLVGCSTNYNEQLADDIRGDLSPELDTMYQRRTDIKNMDAIVVDENLRLLNEDLAHVFLFERPSILADHPMPH